MRMKAQAADNGGERLPVAGAQSVARAAALLRAVGTARSHGSTLTQMASDVGLNVATTRRLLQAMTAEGLLAFDRETKRYRVGAELIALASAGDQMFAERGQLALAAQEVAARTSDTTVLMMRCGNVAVCIGRFEGTFAIRVYSLEVGDVRPLGVGSGTLAMLAFLPEAERKAIQSRNAKEYRRYKLTGEKVEAQVDWARDAGYAFNPGLVLPGVFGIGVPIFRDGAVVSSISVAAIEQRLNRRRRAEVVSIVRNAIRPLKGFNTGD
jgi:DNA-binding IclR family transcriptional regulator